MNERKKKREGGGGSRNWDVSRASLVAQCLSDYIDIEKKRKMSVSYSRVWCDCDHRPVWTITPRQHERSVRKTVWFSSFHRLKWGGGGGPLGWPGDDALPGHPSLIWLTSFTSFFFLWLLSIVFVLPIAQSLVCIFAFQVVARLPEPHFLFRFSSTFFVHVLSGHRIYILYIEKKNEWLYN